MYSMLNGSEVNCVTPVSTAGGLKLNVTSIEVDPIHGYVNTPPYKIICLVIIFIDICTGVCWELMEEYFDWISHWLNLVIVLILLLV